MPKPKAWGFLQQAPSVRGLSVGQRFGACDLQVNRGRYRIPARCMSFKPKMIQVGSIVSDWGKTRWMVVVAMVFGN